MFVASGMAFNRTPAPLGKRTLAALPRAFAEAV